MIRGVSVAFLEKAVRWMVTMMIVLAPRRYLYPVPTQW